MFSRKGYCLVFSVVFLFAASFKPSADFLSPRAYAIAATVEEAPAALLSEQELAALRASMILMRDQAVELMPFAFSTREQKDALESAPFAQERLQAPSKLTQDSRQTTLLLEKMNENAQQLLQKKVFVQNPWAQVTLEIMARNLGESLANYKRNRVELSRDLLRASFHACLNCHASGLSQKQFSADFLLEKYATNLAFEAKSERSGPQSNLRDLSAQGTAEMYFVLRDFTKAMAILNEDLLKPRNGSSAPQEEMELFLTAAILVQTPFEKLVATLEQWKKETQASQTLKEEIELWQRSLKEWKVKFPAKKAVLKALTTSRQKPVSKEKRTLQRPENSLAALLDDLAREVGAKSGEGLLGREKTLVDQLYVKLLLMQVVSETKNALASRARALHLLGLIYRANDKVLFLGLGDAYFSACIDLLPHSAESQACYESLKASIEEASSGSMGTNIDEEDRNFLSAMELKSKPEPKTKSK